MTAIIGAGTQVSSSLISAGFVSVNFSFQPEINRLWQLGSFDAYEIENISQINISLTNYGGGSTSLALTPSTGCVDSNAQMQITVIPAACVSEAISVVDETAFITGYSYSKDYKGWGQESWTLQTKPILIDYTGDIYMIQGLSTGDMLSGTDITSNQGISLTGSVGGTSDDGSGVDMSVSAGELSIGEYGIKVFGKVIAVGGGTGKDDGKRGSSNASIPHQPTYL